MALSDIVELKIEFGLGGEAGGGLWGTALWGQDSWSSAQIQWTDMTSLAQSVTTKTGKQAFLKQFRTGTATIIMDNTQGWFTPDAGVDPPGFLKLRPGRYVRILARSATEAIPPSDKPIPDGATWTDSTGRTWTAHGTGLVLHDEGTPAPPFEPIWFGRIDTIDNRHRDGNLSAIVRCVDGFADLAVNNTVEQPSQGAGELSSARIVRILDHHDWPADRRDIGAGTFTMQPTTLAKAALSELQITTDSEGGDLWQKPNGELAFRGRNWMETSPSWLLGGPTGIPIDSIVTEWTWQRVVNEAHYAAANSTEQVATDTASQSIYGRRTFRRLDLINDDDSQVLNLAQETVARLKGDRLVVTEAAIMVQDAETAQFVTGVSIGDMVQLTVDTIWGWSSTYLVNVISISDNIDASGWVMTLGFTDASVTNEDGPYSRDEYSSAYHLGGTANA